MSLQAFLVIVFLLSTVQSLPPVIVDTDVDIDDLWAIMYLLKSGKVDVKAITVSSNGWSDAIFTVPNIIRTLELIGCNQSLVQDIPVAYGSNVYSAFMDPSGTPYGTVPAALKTPIDSYMTTCLNLTLDTNVRPSPYPAVELIKRILMAATEPIDVLIMGGCTNIAHVISEDRSLISKIGRIFMSGGNFDGRPVVNTYWPYTTKTKGSSWNVFVDPLACHYVYSSGIPLYMHTGQAQDDLPVNVTLIDELVSQYNVPQIFRDFVVQLAPCTGQSESAIQYWDPSAAMFMEQIILGEPNLCTSWLNGTAIVGLTNGGWMGRTFVQPEGWKMMSCTHSDLNSFVPAFWQTLAKAASTTTCLTGVEFTNPAGFSSQADTISAQATEISSLTDRIASLEAAVQKLQTSSSTLLSAPLFALLSLFLVVLF